MWWLSFKSWRWNGKYVGSKVTNWFWFHLDSAESSNGCSNNVNACQQICLPVPGRLFSCACATGFKLNPDNQTCSPYSSFIVVSMLSAIRGFSLELSDHSEAMVPVAGQGMLTPIHVRFNCIWGCIEIIDAIKFFSVFGFST